MQNLFVKFLVLGSVIGSSCFVVWQAHDGLKTAADKINPGEFVALQEQSPEAEEKESTEPASDWGRPLNLTGAKSAQEPGPTLAAAPTQSESDSEEAQTFDPLASTSSPAPAAKPDQKLDDSEFPLFFKDERTANARMNEVPQPLPESLPAGNSELEPLPATESMPAELAANSESPSEEFAELPNQQVESVESEPVPTLAAATLPEPADRPANRFGPAAMAETVPELPEPTPAVGRSREMPGLTRLPPSHPGPVLLPTGSELGGMEVPAADPDASDSGVVTADAVESELAPARTVGGVFPVDAPRELRPVQAAPLMPAELPTLPAAEKPSTREMPAGDPFSSDPFGAPPATAAPTAAPELPAQPEPEVLPEVTPAGGFAPELRSLREPTGVQPVAGEQGPPSMPPLPPTGEVLPDIIPNSSTRAAPVEPTPSPASMSEVLPLPLPPAAKPELPPTEPIPATQLNLPEPSVPQVPAFSLQGSPAPSSVPPGNNLEVMPELGGASIPPSPGPAATPNQLIGTAELDVNAPRGPQSPELKIEKIAPTEAEVGESVIYAIIIRNVGGSDAKDVVVEDRIPRGAQLEGTIPQAYLNDGKLSWQLGTIEPGGERKIQLKVVPIEAGQIGSVATVSFASTVSASIKVNAPKLTIGMTGPTEVVHGEPMSFQFTLRNQGQGVAKSVFLRTILPPGLKHPGGNDLEYESGVLAPGAEKIIDLQVQAEREGVYTIQSMVTNEGKTHDETRADVSVIKSRIEITRTGPENRFVGRPANVMLKVANTSSEVLKGITVQEKLAPGVELTAIPGGGRWDSRSRVVTWKLDELKPGQAREISLLYIAKQPGEHIGRIVAADDAGNQSSLETVLSVKGFAELTPDYRADQRTVLVNERVTLQMTLKNSGTAAGRNVQATFILPEGMEFVSARGPVEYDQNGKQVVFRALTELLPGAEETFHLALLAKQPGTSKVTLKLDAEDYADPVFQDQAIRVISTGP
ncbi:hypothetical protein SH661x_004547 [Planctomicrobium sp. SH661]|uniref:hypothetical protein n=1 Tax=Planctomicrobium sp. SH661 TaxID=3448124 RepID=UPI003F5B0746